MVQVLDHLRVPVNTNERYKRVGDVPYYGANGIQGYIDNSLFNEPLILLAEDGGNFDDYLSKSIAYRINGPSWVNNHAHVLKSIDSNVDLGFLFHALEHRDIRKYISGGTRGKLTQAELCSIEVLTPPTTEQARIAEVLDTLDAVIRSTENIIAKLEAVRQAQLHDLMTRGVDVDGRLRPLQADAPHHYKMSPLGWIPKEWKVATLREAARPSRESFIDGDWIEAPFITSEGIRLIQTGNLGVGEFLDKPDTRRFISAASFRMLNCKWVKAGDILICRLADPIGRACIVPDHVGPSVTSVDCTIFRVEAQCFLPEFVLAWVNADSALKRAQDNAAGSTRSRISRKNLGMLPIAKPPLHEQEFIASALQSSAKLIADEGENLFKLMETKTGIRYDLLTGRVRTAPR
ncbi:MAG: restriction endonuclease subunit S [Syntrophobacteraceae bacterium]|nr:restriction endonuclease subunit S [Syntrophobacteraceae bacterium]